MPRRPAAVRLRTRDRLADRRDWLFGNRAPLREVDLFRLWLRGRCRTSGGGRWRGLRTGREPLQFLNVTADVGHRNPATRVGAADAAEEGLW